MSCYYAKIDENNIVLFVTHIGDEINCPTEAEAQAYLEKNNNWPASKWIKTDEFTKRNKSIKPGGIPFRGNFAGIGFEWDPVNQVFWPPKGNNFNSWVKNLETADWESPAGLQPKVPENEKFTHFYKWVEEQLVWEKRAFPNPISQEVYDKYGDEVLGIRT